MAKDLTYDIKTLVNQFVNNEIDFNSFFEFLSNPKFTKSELFMFIVIEAKLKKSAKEHPNSILAYHVKK